MLQIGKLCDLIRVKRDKWVLSDNEVPLDRREMLECHTEKAAKDQPELRRNECHDWWAVSRLG